MLSNLSFLDISIIVIYFGIILWIAKWAAEDKSSAKGSVDYFLAGKNQGWLVVGASLFASNIGSEIILGVSGAGARAEMPQANFEILASVIFMNGYQVATWYTKDKGEFITTNGGKYTYSDGLLTELVEFHYDKPETVGDTARLEMEFKSPDEIYFK